jgi:tetratricopeptide (TPR) repeat protein
MFKLKKIIVSVLLITLIVFKCHVYAQNPTSKSNTSDDPILNYEKLRKLKDSAYDKNDINELEKLIQIHHNKAKTENNHLEIARSFYYKTVIGTDSLNLKYADSITLVTLDSDHKFYPTLGYIRKGEIYFDSGKFDLSLQNYLTAYDLAIKKDNRDHIQLISHMIAAIRNINGQPNEALNMYHKSLSLLKSQPDYTTKAYSDYTILINNIALSHLRLKNLDSADYYIQIGLQKTLEMDDPSTKIDFKMVEAEVNYFKGNYQIVVDSISKYIDIYSGVDKAIKLYYLGKSNQLLKHKEKALYNFKQIDTIVSLNQDPFDEVKNVYQELILDANNKDEDQLQLEYIEKLIYFDSILTSYKANVFNTATVGYDVPLLKMQKSEIQNKLKTKSKWNLFLIYLTLIAIISVIYFYVREKRIQLKIRKLLDKSNNKPKITTITSTTSINIPDEIASNILIELEKFEKNLEYLDKDLDLPTLSHKLDTNTSKIDGLSKFYSENKPFVESLEYIMANFFKEDVFSFESNAKIIYKNFPNRTTDTTFFSFLKELYLEVKTDKPNKATNTMLLMYFSFKENLAKSSGEYRVNAERFVNYLSVIWNIYTNKNIDNMESLLNKIMKE